MSRPNRFNFRTDPPEQIPSFEDPHPPFGQLDPLPPGTPGTLHPPSAPIWHTGVFTLPAPEDQAFFVDGRPKNITAVMYIRKNRRKILVRRLKIALALAAAFAAGFLLASYSK